jgi:hypothetical protein
VKHIKVRHRSLLVKRIKVRRTTMELGHITQLMVHIGQAMGLRRIKLVKQPPLATCTPFSQQFSIQPLVQPSQQVHTQSQLCMYSMGYIP